MVNVRARAKHDDVRREPPHVVEPVRVSVAFQPSEKRESLREDHAVLASASAELNHVHQCRRGLSERRVAEYRERAIA